MPFQLNFTNTPGASFSVLATTNVALPINQWSNLGTATEVSPGQYQFSDPNATNTAQFYILESQLLIKSVKRQDGESHPAFINSFICNSLKQTLSPRLNFQKIAL